MRDKTTFDITNPIASANLYHKQEIVLANQKDITLNKAMNNANK